MESIQHWKGLDIGNRYDKKIQPNDVFGTSNHRLRTVIKTSLRAHTSTNRLNTVRATLEMNRPRVLVNEADNAYDVDTN